MNYTIFECPQFKTDFIIINTILSNVFTGLISNGFDDYYEKYEQKQDDIENKAIYICNLSKNKTDLIVY